MDPKQHDQDRMFLEMVVTDMAQRAMQIPPSERYTFIMREIDKVRGIFDEKYGRHPQAFALDLTLREWARTFVKILEEPSATSGHP